MYHTQTLHLSPWDSFTLDVAKIDGDTYALRVYVDGSDPVAIIFGTAEQLAELAPEAGHVVRDIMESELEAAYERLDLISDSMEIFTDLEYPAGGEPMEAEPFDPFGDWDDDPYGWDDGDGAHETAFWLDW